MYFVFWKIDLKSHIKFYGEDIDCNQHSYINGKSTLSDLEESFDIKNEYLIKRDNVDIIYLNFNKTVTMVSHYHLLVKKKNLGIFFKYAIFPEMFDQTMKVKIGSNYCERQNIHSSISQESVLGHFIFMNNLPNDIKSEIKLFPDDVKLIVRPLLNETI